MTTRRERTDEEIEALLRDEHDVRITFPGDEYGDVAMLAEARGLSIEAFVRDCVRQVRDRMFTPKEDNDHAS